jgi:hypothetical protein
MSTGTQEIEVSTDTPAINPVEFDEHLYELYQQASKIEDQLESNRDYQHIAAGDRKEWIGGRQYWRRTSAEVLESLQIMAKDGVELPASISRGGRRTARQLLTEEDELMVAQAEAANAINQQEAIYRLPENRWPRYFRCLNSDGHIHSSLRGCPTVRWDTPMGWNTDLSGRPVKDAIDKLGPTLCSVCYPGAPVEWRQKKSDVERAEREARKAAAAEAKFIKRLRPDEVIVIKRDGLYEHIETVAACLEALRKEVEFRDYYGHGQHHWHAAWAEAAEKAKAVLLAREAKQAGTGATQGKIDATIASAVKRNIRDGARLDPVTGEARA